MRVFAVFGTVVKLIVGKTVQIRKRFFADSVQIIKQKVVAENRFTRRIGIVHARSINSFDIFCEAWYTN